MRYFLFPIAIVILTSLLSVASAANNNSRFVPSAPSIIEFKNVAVVNDPVLTPVLVPINNVITVPVPVYNYFHAEEFYGNGFYPIVDPCKHPKTIRDGFYNDNRYFENKSGHKEEFSDQIVDLIVNKVVEKLLRDAQEQSKNIKLPPVKNGNGSRDVGDKEDLEGKALKILAQNCSKCHTGQKAKGKFVIFLSEDVLNPKVDKKAIYEAVSEGFMPPSNTGFKVKQNEIEVLKLWSES